MDQFKKKKEEYGSKLLSLIREGLWDGGSHIHSFLVSRIPNAVRSWGPTLTTCHWFRTAQMRETGKGKLRDWHQLLRI